MGEEHPASTCLAQDPVLRQHNERGYWSLPQPSALRSIAQPARGRLTAAASGCTANSAVVADSRFPLTVSCGVTTFLLAWCSPCNGVSALLLHRLAAIKETRSAYCFLCPGNGYGGRLRFLPKAGFIFSSNFCLVYLPD